MISVTGASGQVGRPIGARVLAEGAPMRALTRSPATAGLPAGAEVAPGRGAPARPASPSAS